MGSKFLDKINSINEKNVDDDKELVKAIQKMNLTDMKAYLNNKTKKKANNRGLAEILRKIIEVNPTTKMRYINEGDDKSKIKKCFEIVLAISKNHIITNSTIELIVEFKDTYEDLIKNYDHDTKDIYFSRFTKSISRSVDVIICKSNVEAGIDIVKHTH